MFLTRSGNIRKICSGGKCRTGNIGKICRVYGVSPLSYFVFDLSFGPCYDKSKTKQWQVKDKPYHLNTFFLILRSHLKFVCQDLPLLCLRIVNDKYICSQSFGAPFMLIWLVRLGCFKTRWNLHAKFAVCCHRHFSRIEDFHCNNDKTGLRKRMNMNEMKSSLLYEAYEIQLYYEWELNNIELYFSWGDNG